MIDHDAALELWDRYRRGESNVFTRRLYTLQGQQTFDEIRRKYGRDEEFRQTGRPLCRGVRAPLAEVSRDDRDSMLTKTYLTSETGKVYTMLATRAAASTDRTRLNRNMKNAALGPRFLVEGKPEETVSFPAAASAEGTGIMTLSVGVDPPSRPCGPPG